MTAKNRHKNSTSDKTLAPTQEDAPKKTSKTSSNGVASSAGQGPRSGSCLGFFVSAVFYVTLLAAAGFGAFYLQQVVEEIRQTSARHEKSAQQNAELIRKMGSVAQQVESLSSLVDGLESSLGITRVELEVAVSRMKKGEVETRKVEEALHKLQNDLLRDLSQGMSEVKEAREKDFSSLERTVEERLAEVSQSIRASVSEFTEAQGDAQTQLAELKAQLGDMEDPALVKQELSAIVETVAEIKTAKQEADASVDTLRQQISLVREELQTRNQEVASLSEEIEAVKIVVQENISLLRQSVSEAEASVQAVKDNSETVDSRLELNAAAVRSVEGKLEEATAQALKRSDELEVRVRASEETSDALSTSLTDTTSTLQSLLSKLDAHESTLATQGEAVDKTKSSFEQEIDALKSQLDELQSRLTAGQDSRGQQVEDIEKRLEALENSSAASVKTEQLQGLQSLVKNLESKAAKLEGHEEAISALQKALQKTTQTLAGLTSAPKPQAG